MATGRRQCMRVFTSVVAALFVLAAFAISALAQSPTSRVYLRFAGEHTDELSSASVRFQQPILREQSVEFAGTAEMEQVYSQCATDLGVNASEERECQLQAARRIMVEEVIEISMSSPTRGTYELVIEVWSPDSNGLVHADYVEVEAESLSGAVRSGLPALARSYLCWTGQEAHCSAVGTPIATSGNPTDPHVLPSTGRLEIMNVTPAPVAILVDGREVGTAPGQFLNLPLGRVEVTLRAPGYEDLTRTLTLTAERMEELNGLALEPLPATLTLTCNVEGAEIRIDGRAEGQTRGGRTVSLTLGPGSRRVSVTRSGYSSFERTVDLTAGSSLSIEVILEIELVPEPAVAITVLLPTPLVHSDDGWDDMSSEELFGLSDALDDRGADEGRLALVEWVVAAYPNLPELPLWSGHLRDCLTKIGSWDRYERRMRELVAFFDPNSTWAVINYQDQRAVRAARQFSEETFLGIILRNYAECVRRSRNELCEEVAEDYTEFFERWPNSDRAYDQRFNWAEVLYYNIEDQVAAGEQYLETVRMDTRGEYAHDAIVGALQAFDLPMTTEHPDINEERLQLTQEAATESCGREPQELGRWSERYLEAAVLLTELYPDDELIPVVCWRAAEIYRRTNRIGDALPVLDLIGTQHPGHSLAENASRTADVIRAAACD